MSVQKLNKGMLCTRMVEYLHHFRCCIREARIK